jgi:hypothetical protein
MAWLRDCEMRWQQQAVVLVLPMQNRPAQCRPNMQHISLDDQSFTSIKAFWNDLLCVLCRRRWLKNRDWLLPQWSWALGSAVVVCDRQLRVRILIGECTVGFGTRFRAVSHLFSILISFQSAERTLNSSQTLNPKVSKMDQLFFMASATWSRAHPSHVR